jgi:small-conductance mechanosensitive channel
VSVVQLFFYTKLTVMNFSAMDVVLKAIIIIIIIIIITIIIIIVIINLLERCMLAANFVRIVACIF